MSYRGLASAGSSFRFREPSAILASTISLGRRPKLLPKGLRCASRLCREPDRMGVCAVPAMTTRSNWNGESATSLWKDAWTLSVSHAAGRGRRAILNSVVQDNAIDLVIHRAASARGARIRSRHGVARRPCVVRLCVPRQPIISGVLDDIVVFGSGGPLDPVKIGMAGRIAEAEEATIRLVHVLADHASGRQVHSLRTYHAALDGVTPVRTYSDISQNEALVQELAERSRNADLVVMGALRSRFRLLTDLVDRIREQVDAPVLLVRTHELARRPSLAGRILERLLR